MTVSNGNHAGPRAKANKIRQDARTGDYGVMQLSKRYGLACPTIYKILAQKRCQDGTPPISITKTRGGKRAALVALWHSLGFTYNQCGAIVGLSQNHAARLGAAYAKGLLPKRDDLIVRVRLPNAIEKIPPGNYELVPIDDEKVLLATIGGSEVPSVTTIAELIGKIKPYDNQTESTSGPNRESAKS